MRDVKINNIYELMKFSQEQEEFQKNIDMLLEFFKDGEIHTILKKDKNE